MKCRKITTFILILAVLGLVSCKKNNYPNEPVLEFLSVSKQYMLQNGQDSMVLTLSYTDGDGDIGSDVNDNIFLRDNRTGALIASYRFPNDTDQEAGTYRKGELQLIVYSACCIYNDTAVVNCGPNPNQSLDTLRYTIEVVDQSGRESNIIETSDIYLECN